MPMPEGPKEWSPSQHVAIRVNAGHDVNGNPRRGWVITSCRKGGMVDFVDEGYTGSSNLMEKYPHAAIGPTFNVGAMEYRSFIKLSREREKQKPELGRRSTMATVKGKVPPVLMAWVACRKESGVKPGVKMTARQKAEARTCVVRQMRKKLGSKK